MNLPFCLTPMFCPLGGRIGQAVMKPSPPRQRWTLKAQHGARQPSTAPAQPPSHSSRCLHRKSHPKS